MLAFGGKQNRYRPPRFNIFQLVLPFDAAGGALLVDNLADS